MATTGQPQKSTLFSASIIALLAIASCLPYSISTHISNNDNLSQFASIVTMFSHIIMFLGFACSTIALMVGYTPREEISPSFRLLLGRLLIGLTYLGAAVSLAYLYMMGSDLINLENQHAGAVSFQFLIPLSLVSLALHEAALCAIFDG